METATNPTRTARAADITGHLARARYLRLTTFRKTGEPVATPVWFAPAGDRVYEMSDGTAGKVKRIRHTGRVLVAPSDWRGRPTGGDLEAAATIIADPAERAAAGRALGERYGWQWRALAWLGERRRRRSGAPDGRVYLVIAAG